jgi:multidrug transporter EmrE-like cation transporter
MRNHSPAIQTAGTAKIPAGSAVYMMSDTKIKIGNNFIDRLRRKRKLNREITVLLLAWLITSLLLLFLVPRAKLREALVIFLFKQLLLIISFLLTGLVLITNKALVAWGLEGQTDLYMLAFYGVPLVLAVASNAFHRQKSSRTDIFVGLAMGVAGATGTLFLMLALAKMDGIVAFPVRNLGNVVLTGIVGIIFWKERLSKTQWLGILLSLAAISLIY